MDIDPLIDLIDPEAFQTGIFKDLAPGQNGLWKYGENLDFIDGAVQKTSGWSFQGAAPGPVWALTQAYVEGERRIYIGTASSLSVLVDNITTILDIGYTFTKHWELQVWGSWLIASNGIDEILVWKNTGSPVDLGGISDLSDPPPAFSVMGKTNQHLIGYWGTTLYFSTKDNPEEWLSTQSNSAGFLLIRDLDSDVVAAKPLGLSYIVYSLNTALRQEYVDTPLYFGFPNAPLKGIGALSADAIVPVGDQHFGVCQKGFFVTDGLSFRYIDRPMVNRWFLEHIDLNRAAELHGVHWEQNTTVRWTFVCKDGVRRGLDYNYESKAWCVHTLPLVASSEQTVFPYPVVAESNYVGLLGEAVDRGGNKLDTLLQTFPFDGGTRIRYKVWHRFEFIHTGQGLLEVQIGFHNAPDAEPEWLDWQPVTKTVWLTKPRASVFLTLKFRSNTLGVNWRLSVLKVFGTLGGQL